MPISSDQPTPGAQGKRPVDRFAMGLVLMLWAALTAVVAAVAGDAWHIGSVHFPADGLALTIVLLTLFVAAVVSTFALRYMRADPHRLGFSIRIALLVASVLGFVLAGNLITLALAWCASGVLLARLIGHDGDRAEARAAARRAARTFALGDAALLAALALLGLHAGSLRLDAVLAAAPTLPAGVAATAALLLLIAAVVRCGLPPFSTWLLASMTAPTPVSALMHAGMVNAGGFLLLRFAPLFEAAPEMRAAAVAVGLVAALYGIGVSSVRPDIKRSLAGSTVSQMGFMIMSCGLGAYAAALWHIVAHGLFKAWLFLGSGATVGVRRDRPLALRDPRGVAVIAAATFVLGAAMTIAGRADGSQVPLLLGIATAAASLRAGVKDKLALSSRLSLTGTVAVLVGFHAAGLVLIGAAFSPVPAPLLPAGALLALTGGFLALWVWQERRQAAAVALPPGLYVRLLNAGTIRPLAET